METEGLHVGSHREYGSTKSGDLSTSTSASATVTKRPWWFGWILFSQVDSLVAAGNFRQIVTDDLLAFDRVNKARVVAEQFETKYERQHRSLTWAVVAQFGCSFLVSGSASLITTACSVLAPVVLNRVVMALSASSIDTRYLSMWLAVFVASRVVNALVSTHGGYYAETIAVRLSVALRSLLFNKTLRISRQRRGNDEPPVEVANLFSSDVRHVLDAAYQLPNLWILPVQIAVVIALLWQQLGIATVGGLGVMALSVVASTFIARISGAAFVDVMERQDARMRAVKETFNSIQAVKLGALEETFENQIQQRRVRELRALTKYVYALSTSIVVLWSTPIFVSVASFALYGLVMHQTLTAATIFTAIALFNLLRDPIRRLPNVIQLVIQATISLRRISAYLALEEYDSTAVDRRGDSTSTTTSVALENATLGWLTEAPTLRNVSMKVERGDLVVVSGPVGSGKSALCAVLLGELAATSGRVSVRGSVAYFAQQPWLQHRTIRENIVFGRRFDPCKYQAVLDVCGLHPDLGQFAAGDATEIGQRGVTLSGGQRARVALARACYADADVLILDSPLAAVDTVVQSEIFAKCICGLLADKTVVLVTHNPEIVASKAVDTKVSITESGQVQVESQNSQRRRPGANSLTLGLSDANHTQPENADAGRLVPDEERQAGRVSWSVYRAYFRAVGGVGVCAFLLLVQLVWQGFQIASDLWLSRWSSGHYGSDDTGFYMAVYAALAGTSALMVLMRAIAVAFVGLRASRRLFTSMTTALLRAPLRFFDTNPIGRVLNRYGDDMSMVDDTLQFVYGSLLAFVSVAVCQLLTAVVLMKWLGLLVFPLIVVYVRLVNAYLAPSREVARLWKASESPLLSLVSEAADGAITIRAFGDAAADDIKTTFSRSCDENTRAWLARAALDQWLALRMHLIGCGVVVTVVFALFVFRESLSPGLAGLVFAYALNVDGVLADLADTWAYLEIQMVSPERILAYAAIAPEETGCVASCSEDWPSDGAIRFERVVFAYDGLHPALKSVTFSCDGGEKVGVVGRTGAGKSSLVMALFRVNRLVSGSILIDGVDISSVPLHALRSRMTVIPQSPVLFKGSLRRVLDPFDAFTDAEIWSALERVSMKTRVNALPDQLLYQLSTNGDNLSVGERQLLCLARALMKRSRVVILDEATASIDHETERRLQQMIATEFGGVTLLTIAHRVATVLGCDRILVLSDGKAVEFDTPRTLARQPSGVFYQLAKEGGYIEQLLE